MVFPYIILFIVWLCLSPYRNVKNENHKRAEAYEAVGSCALYLSIAFYLRDIFTSPEDFPTVWSYIKVFLLYMLACIPIIIIFFYIAHRRNLKMQKRYDLYGQLVEGQGITNVYKIAAITGINANDVMQDLKYLMDQGKISTMFKWNKPDEDEDEDDREENVEAEDHQKAYPAIGDHKAAQKENFKVAVTCTGCGASSSLWPGTSEECEYCGKTLV